MVQKPEHFPVVKRLRFNSCFVFLSSAQKRVSGIHCFVRIFNQSEKRLKAANGPLPLPCLLWHFRRPSPIHGGFSGSPQVVWTAMPVGMPVIFYILEEDPPLGRGGGVWGRASPDGAPPQAKGVLPASRTSTSVQPRMCKLHLYFYHNFYLQIMQA